LTSKVVFAILRIALNIFIAKKGGKIMRKDPFAFERMRLKNGSQIFYQPAEDKQTILRFLLKAGGARYDKPEREGCAHLLEHLIGEKTRSYGKIELRDYQLENLISMMALTNMESIWVKGNCPEKKVNQLLSLIKDQLTFSEAQITEKVLTEEKQIIRQEMSLNHTDPDLHQAQLEVRSALLHDHSFSRFIDAMGSAQSLNRIEREDLIDHYSQFFIAPNLFVVAITRLSKSEVRNLVLDLPLFHKGKINYPEFLSTAPVPKKKLIVHQLEELVKGRKIKMGDALQLYAVIAGEDVSLAWSPLTRTIEEILNRELRVKHSLAYSVDISSSRHRDFRMFKVGVKVPQGQGKKTRQKILEAIERFGQFQPLFEKIKKEKLYELETYKALPQEIADSTVEDISVRDFPLQIKEIRKAVNNLDFRQTQSLVEKWLSRDRILTHLMVA